MCQMLTVGAYDVVDIQELALDEVGQVDGARGVGSVSSDAIFAAGVAIVLTGAGNPVSDVVGGFLIGWGLA